VKLESLGALVTGNHENPFEVLGPHSIDHGGKKALAVRAYLPDSQQAWLVHPAHGVSRPMRRIHPAGVFEAVCPLPSSEAEAHYEFRVANQRGEFMTMHDPYRFKPLLTDFDVYLLSEGTHWRSYERLGAQLRTVDGVAGVNFAVWAPNASGVSVVGDFNGWDSRRHPMRKLIPSGFWELFVPNIGPGEKYKYHIRNGLQSMEKSDPYGYYAELPPCTASIVADLTRYEWGDHHWMEGRKKSNPLEQPLCVYEVHLGSWKRCVERSNGWLNYRELAHQLADYCREQGFTHVELLPVSEHPYTLSWGYQTVGYYAVTSRYGTPEDFMYFVDHLHRQGIGVLIDWVPAHFPRDGHGLRRFDGTALYEHEDPRQGEHPDWGTLIFNYGRNEVSNFLISNALFWLDRYHIDGLRVDAVASMLYLDYSRGEGEWIPNEYGGRENLQAISFVKKFNEEVHGQFPGVLTIAEESTAFGGVSRPTFAGGLGFSIKWNMGWMNDTLRYMRHEPIHRRYHHDELTFSLIYAFSENFSLPLSHDEVVHGKGSLLDQMPGDLWQKFANLRLLFSYMWTHPGKKLLFMGSDFGQWNEWNCETSLQWDLLQWDSHKGLKKLVADLNAMLRREPALYEVDFEYTGFEWIDCHSRDDSVLAYLRKAKNPEDMLAVCMNFTPVPRNWHRLAVPHSTTAAPTSAPTRAYWPKPSRTTAARSRYRSACPPWAWWCSNPNRAARVRQAEASEWRLVTES
jgi:1,4-alpha-glucan branching enzyme